MSLISITSTMILIVLGVFLLYFGIIRNTQVYNYRIRLIDKISKRNQEDWESINPNQPASIVIYNITNRHQQFMEVSYDNMVFHFWKPLDSFYKDKNSLKDLLE